jgi:ribosomal protein S18 acetylase RimI-like enzyme
VDRRRLVELKIAMEFGTAPDGDTLPKAAKHEVGQPQLVVSRFNGDTAVFFRYDLEPDERAELLALGVDTLFSAESRVRAILDPHHPTTRVYRMRWYIIDRVPDPSEYRDVTVQDDRHVVKIDGEVVAWAKTDTDHEEAVEVEIETLPNYRRRGFARQVTASWAASALASGKVAFYSHLVENSASQAVAVSLGLTHLSDEVEYV